MPETLHGERDVETIIEPQSGWPSLGIKDLWRYRDLVYNLTVRNVKVRYKQTVLGVLWAVLQPLVMMAVLSLTLQRFVPHASRELPYLVFVFSGLLPWFFFQTAVTTAANSVVGSEGLVTKVYFPRLAIPLSAVAAALIDLAIAFVVLLVLMLWYGIWPTARLALLPLAVAFLFMAAMGIGTLIAALTVSFRDFRHAIPYVLQVWMIATPTIYWPADVPPAGSSGPVQTAGRAESQADSSSPAYQKVGWFARLSRLNPVTVPIDFFRAATVGRPIPWEGLPMAGVEIVLFLAGLYYFRHVEDSFADVI
jgi:homopolymeric O-antigen transport system permease protein